MLYSHHFEAFLARAVEAAHKTRFFEREWCRLQWPVPQIQAAWERGQVLFQEELARATANSEEMESLSMIDFAVDCYAAVDVRRSYDHNRVQHKHGPRVDTCWRGGSMFLRRKTGLSHVMSVCCDRAWALIGGQEVILKTFFVLIFEHTSCVAEQR